MFALRDKRDNFYQGRMTYKQGLITGLFITLFVTILSPLTQYITSVFITPHYFTNVVNYAVDHSLIIKIIWPNKKGDCSISFEVFFRLAVLNLYGITSLCFHHRQSLFIAQSLPSRRKLTARGIYQYQWYISD